MIDLHIKTSELMKIKDIIGKEGEDYRLKLESGIVFKRENNVCSIEWVCFSMNVNKMSISKIHVMFENSECPMNHVYISRSKTCPF